MFLEELWTCLKYECETLVMEIKARCCNWLAVYIGHLGEDSSRDASTRAEIVQCLRDMIRPGRSGTCRRSSLVPFIPGWAYCTNLFLDYALVSEKVGKIVNFEKHDVWPWREPRKV